MLDDELVVPCVRLHRYTARSEPYYKGYNKGHRSQCSSITPLDEP